MNRSSVGATVPQTVRALPLFGVALVFLLLIFGVFRVIDAPLQTSVAPQGIVSFELAGTGARAQAMLDSWDARARLYAAFGLGLDYLFMVSYAAAIGLAAAWAGRQLGARRRWPIALGVALGWGLAFAALLDAVENIALTVMLLAGVADAPWPALAAVCATVKFALVLLGFLYASAGAVSWLLGGRRFSNSQNPGN